MKGSSYQCINLDILFDMEVIALIIEQVYYDFELNDRYLSDILSHVKKEIRKEFKGYDVVIHQVIKIEDDYFTAIINIMEY
jgi:hypothetical protein